MVNNPSKWAFITAGVILAAVVAGMLLIRWRRVETNITAKTTTVGLIVVGKKNDASFCQSHYDALMGIKDELNLRVVCREKIPEGAACVAAIESLIADEGCKVVITASFWYGKHLVEVAKRHPGVCFIHPTGNMKRANLTSCMGRMYQARYLSGIVAGMRSASGKIGFVGAFPYPEVVRGINAFALGARSVAPGAQVYVRYSFSWVDDAAAQAAREALLAAHPDIDVFAMHTNSLLPNRVAASRGIWSVGYNKDNARSFPDSYLTACEWVWGPYYRQKILSWLRGKFHGDIDWIGLDGGIVRLSALTKNVAPGTQAAVDAAERRFASRGFDVFYGPVVDNAGVMRVPKGESMSDEEMLNRFSWYVEGVTVEK